MNTSILTVVLTSALLTGDPTAPTWHNSYGQARVQGAAQQKPLAVVFGAGASNWTKVVSEASPSGAVKQLLVDKYVCLYVDTSTASGKKLALAFEINSNTGLVISDRTGELQAFWHQGDLTNADLSQYLEKYAAQRIAQTTDVAVTTRTSFYPPTTAGSSSGLSLYQDGTNPFASGYCPSCNNVRSSRR